jgi:hypothetical protein
MSLEDHARDAIDDGLRNGVHDLGRKPSEIFLCFRAERNRSATIIEDPISSVDLPVFTILGRYAIPLGLRKVVPYRRPIHEVLLFYHQFCLQQFCRPAVPATESTSDEFRECELPHTICFELPSITKQSLRSETARAPEDGAPDLIARSLTQADVCAAKHDLIRSLDSSQRRAHLARSKSTQSPKGGALRSVRTCPQLCSFKR